MRMTEYPHLFTPLTIRGRTIPNRIVSTPHATGWELPGGLISDKEVDYHVRKAAGGVGLVMTFGSALRSKRAVLRTRGARSPRWPPSATGCTRDGVAVRG